jgi:hypothetical protein
MLQSIRNVSLPVNPLRIDTRSIAAGMNADPETAARLRSARVKAGFESAALAARALGMKPPTYVHHENATRGLLDHASVYASFFGVSLEWLVTGRGSMTGAPGIPFRGHVGAGERVDLENNARDIERGVNIEMPRPRDSDAFIVRGDSMLPRFFRGEVLIFESRPTPPERLINQICRVELTDGSTFVKILRRTEGQWRLQSINFSEPDIEKVGLDRAYRWLALLPPRNVAAFMLAPPNKASHP